MKNIAFSALAMTAFASPALGAEVQIQASGPVVELSVNESISAKPDIATIGAGVTTEAATAVAAMRQNAGEMDKVIKRLKALGIKAEDIQTSGINLSPRYDYDQTAQRQIFRGYSASNRVSATLRKVAETGNVLDALVAAGATDLSGPDFSIDNDSAVKAKARQSAMQRAQAEAQQYARWAGYTGVRLLEVSESISAGRPMVMKSMDSAMEAMATPVEPGRVGTSVTLTVKYEMTR